MSKPILSYEEYKEQNKDLFKNHQAKLTKLDGKDCIIEFEKKDTNVGSMLITYIGGIISISGDYGYAMFNWDNRKNSILAYPTFKNFGYVLEKMVASEPYKEFDYGVFQEDFNKWKLQLVEEGYDEDFINGVDIPYVEDRNDVVAYFKNFSKIDDLWEYDCYNFGTYLNRRTYIRWHGFIEAVNKIEKDF